MQNMDSRAFRHKHTATEQRRWESEYEIGQPLLPDDMESISYTNPYFDKKKRQQCFSRFHFTMPVADLLARDGHYISDEKNVGAFLQGGMFFPDERSNGNLHYMRLMAFDVDAGMSYDGVGDAVARHGFEARISTTWSHQQRKKGQPSCDRMRVFLLFREPLVFTEIEAKYDICGTLFWKCLYGIVGRKLGLPYDAACSDPARLFFFAACPSDMRDAARSVLIKGARLDWEEFADEAIALVRDVVKSRARAREVRRAQREAMGDDVEPKLRDAIDALAYVDPSLPYQDWRDLIFAMQSEFGGTIWEDDALDALIEWSAGSTDKFDHVAEENLRRMWEDADSDGDITIGTLFYHANEGGYDPNHILDEKLAATDAAINKLMEKING